MYIVEAKEIPERRPYRERKPYRGNRRDEVRQVMVGQFPLSYNLDTGVFALAGTRLTALQWIELKTEVDNFLVKYNLLNKLEVHDFRPSLSKRAATALRWLTRR